MDNYRAKELIRKYLDGNCTVKEKAMLESWYLEYSRLRENRQIVDYDKTGKEIWREIQRNKQGAFVNKRLWYTIAAAAVIILLFTFSFLLYHSGGQNRQVTVKTNNTSIQPGGRKAILTLADGTHIILDDAKSGLIKTKQGITIQKDKNGLLVYNAFGNSKISGNKNTDIIYNTISTPNGGEYQVILPDGTKVWLNSATSLVFPVEFSAKDREVVLTHGEAYFEVAKSKEKPFKVRVEDAEIRVLGTHFNISAYPEESEVITTLLEGSVKVSKGKNTVMLQPGQRAAQVKNTSDIEISDASIEEAVAWKNGYFKFNNENIKSIMNRVARWYDIEVVYEGNMQGKNFGGTFSRSKSISDLLKNLERTGTIHFKIEGRRIIIME